MTEFQNWLETNKEKFTTYQNGEIADVALACGFDKREVSQWLVRETFRKAA